MDDARRYVSEFPGTLLPVFSDGTVRTPDLPGLAITFT